MLGLDGTDVLIGNRVQVLRAASPPAPLNFDIHTFGAPPESISALETPDHRRAIVVVLDVFLPAPDQLHGRRRHLLRDSHRLIDEVMGTRQTAAEAAAELLVVDRDLVRIEVWPPSPRPCVPPVDPARQSTPRNDRWRCVRSHSSAPWSRAPETARDTQLRSPSPHR